MHSGVQHRLDSVKHELPTCPDYANALQINFDMFDGFVNSIQGPFEVDYL